MRWLGLVIILLAACTSSVRTGDVLIDEVVSRQSGYFSTTTCVGVRGVTRVFKPDASGPPAILGPSKIKNLDARNAAEAIAVHWQNASEQDVSGQAPRMYGQVTHGECAMMVDRPAYSAAFAFVSYSDPGGEIGTYVFQHGRRQWRYVERVKLGFW